MKAIVLPCDMRETLAFPDDQGRWRELDAKVDSLERRPEIEEVIVACDSRRYLDAVEWLRSRKDSEVVLRVVRVGSETSVQSSEAVAFLCEELNLVRRPGELVIATVAS